MTKLLILYDFRPGPWGGGNQFLKALAKSLKQSGNLASSLDDADAVILNSHHWNTKLLWNLFRWQSAHPTKPILHRVDGPIGDVRATFSGKVTDLRIWRVSRLFSSGTVFQSNWSRSRALATGFNPPRWKIIRNAPDQDIFFLKDKLQNPTSNRPKNVITTSWSANRKKGFRFLSRLANEADPRKIRITAIGNYPGRLARVRMLDPLPSEELASELRAADVFLALSEDDPCSNSLIEAIHCGLVPVGLDSGGHTEIIGNSSLLFRSSRDLLAILERPLGDLIQTCGNVAVDNLSDVADAYVGFATEMASSPKARLTPINVMFLIVADWLLRALEKAVAFIEGRISFSRRK